MTVIKDDEILCSQIRLEAVTIVQKARVLLDDGDGIFKMLEHSVATENDIRSQLNRIRAHCTRIEVACSAVEKLVDR